jgi:hypothetical protein
MGSRNIIDNDVEYKGVSVTYILCIAANKKGKSVGGNRRGRSKHKGGGIESSNDAGGACSVKTSWQRDHGASGNHPLSEFAHFERRSLLTLITLSAGSQTQLCNIFGLH